MNSILRKFLERVRQSTISGSLLPAHGIALGEIPPLDLSDCLDAYLKDPACRSFVDFLADQAVGSGFYITADENYPQAKEAKRLVEEFCEQVNLDGLLQVGAREIIATGNSFWERIEPDYLTELRILPLTSVARIKRDAYGMVEGFIQSNTYGGRTLAPERIIHFKWNPVNSEPFGTGILRSLLEEMSFDEKTRMSFLEMKARIECMLPEIFEKYAGPDELWIFQGIPDDRLKEYQAIIRNKPKAGARFVYNQQADVKTIQIDPRTQFQSYLEHILNQIYLGGQTPLPKLFTTPGFTEASAKAAIDIAERQILSLQRFIKRIVEREILAPLVEQGELDPVEARVRLNWGLPEKPEVRVADLLKAAELKLIQTDEFRNIMRGLGWEL